MSRKHKSNGNGNGQEKVVPKRNYNNIIITAKTPNQKKLMAAIKSNIITIVHGCCLRKPLPLLEGRNETLNQP